MDNIVFILYPENGNPNNYYYLDVAEETIISVTYSIQDIQDITKRKGSYSKTISFPGTETNNRAFKNAYNVQAFIGGFTPNQQIKCQVHNDGVQIFVGTLQLLSINLIDGKPIYECAIYSDEITFFHLINDVLLPETTGLNNYDHTWNRTNFPSVFENTYVDGYVYALVDNVGLWHCKETTSQGNGGLMGGIFTWLQQIMDRIIPLEVFKPSMYVKTMVDLIFAQHGFTYQSNFFNTSLFERLIIPYCGDGMIYDDTANMCYVGNKDEIVPDGYPETQTILWDQTASPYINTNCGTMNGANGVYTACGSYNGNYYMELSLPLVGGYIDDWSLQIAIKDFDTGLTIYAIDGQELVFTYSGPTAAFRAVIIQAHISLKASQRIFVEVSFILNSVINNSLGDGYWLIDLVKRLSLEGVNVEMASTLPATIKQIDLLSDLQKMFNLYFMISPENPKKIIIEPFDSFYTNNSLDWSKKIDASKEIQITCGDPENRKRFIFSYASTNEAQAKQYRDDENEQYGNRIFDTLNFYGNGDDTITTKCGILIPSQYRTKSVIGRTWSLNGNGVIAEGKIGYRIAQYNYIYFVPDGGNNYEWWLYPDADNTIDLDSANVQTLWPYCGHVDNPYAPAEDISFGMPKRLYYKLFDEQSTYIQYTNNNLFNRFWYLYITEITSAESMTIEAFFEINITDIAQLDFRNPIYFNGIKWRLLEISDYEIGKNKLVKCKLRRILNLTAFEPIGIIPLNNTGVVYSPIKEPTPIFSTPTQGL